MTKSKKDDTAKTDPSKKPSHIAYHVPDREGAPWTRIGAVWPHKDGKGFRLRLELMPVNSDTIEFRVNEPKNGANEAEGGAD